MKVISTTPSFGKFHDNIEHTLKEKGVILTRVVPFDREKVLKEIVDADVLVVGLEPVDAEMVKQARSLKLIAKHGVGIDNIDLEAAKNAGVVVTNTPGKNNDAVADLAFGHMLSTARLIPETNCRVKNGEWPRYDGRSVWGKTLGIIGLGAIGKGVAKRANGFSMEILAYDVTPESSDEKELDIQRVSLIDLLQCSDYISLHVPLNEHTRGIIGAKELKEMKETAVLINTARGGLVDEEALYEALSKGWIHAAGLDVFEEEPATNNKLLTLDNLVATSHMGAFTVEAGYAISETIIQSIDRLLAGKQLEHAI
jgi:D-3-phosphoglycerate dehydrogenase